MIHWKLILGNTLKKHKINTIYQLLLQVFTTSPAVRKSLREVQNVYVITVSKYKVFWKHVATSGKIIKGAKVGSNMMHLESKLEPSKILHTKIIYFLSKFT